MAFLCRRIFSSPIPTVIRPNACRSFSLLSPPLPPTQNTSGTVISMVANLAKIHHHETRLELTCQVETNLKLMVGDTVPLNSVDWSRKTAGTVDSYIPRKSYLLHPPFANLDRIMVMFSMKNPPVKSDLLTRFLVSAECAKVPIHVILNKAELAEEEELEVWKAKLDKWKYEYMFVSLDDNRGIDEIKGLITESKITALIGPSGVGKTSLIKAVTGDVKKINRTSNVSLLPLANGGYIGDSPGFYNVNFDHIKLESLPFLFPEISKIHARKECKFRNCAHLDEPGCSVRGLWERLSLERYKMYDKIAKVIKKKSRNNIKDETATRSKRGNESHRRT